MSIQFVATTVVQESDGISFGAEEAIESEEVKRARVQAERAAQKPLYEQLAEREAKKKEEYDRNTKVIS